METRYVKIPTVHLEISVALLLSLWFCASCCCLLMSCDEAPAELPALCCHLATALFCELHLPGLAMSPSSFSVIIFSSVAAETVKSKIDGC